MALGWLWRHKTSFSEKTCWLFAVKRWSILITYLLRITSCLQVLSVLLIMQYFLKNVIWFSNKRTYTLILFQKYSKLALLKKITAKVKINRRKIDKKDFWLIVVFVTHFIIYNIHDLESFHLQYNYANNPIYFWPLFWVIFIYCLLLVVVLKK